MLTCDEMLLTYIVVLFATFGSECQSAENSFREACFCD